jgi:hypothetical protein
VEAARLTVAAMGDLGPTVGQGCKTFLVEHYWPGVTADVFGSAAAELRSSTEAMAAEQRAIRFLHSTLVPEDEAAFCVFEAESQALVEEVYARAGVAFERIRDAVETDVFNPDPAPAAAGGRRKEDSNA